MKYLLIALVVLFYSEIIPQNDDWKFSGQIQLRSELDGRDFRHKTHPLTFASLRTRVGVEKTFMDKLNFFVQIQDSRVFGEEGNTLTAIDNIDLHQGYVTLKQLFDWNMDVQGGRFEVVYGTERFFGAVGWHYIGRAWDGVRFKFYPGFKLDLFALTHTESVSYIGNATPGIYPFPQMSTPSYSVYGFWESANLSQSNQLDLFGYYEINRTKVNDNPALNRFTLGLNHFGNYGSLSTILEAAYQLGSIGSFDVSAYLVTAQGSYQTNGFKFGLGADLISGMEPGSDKINSFFPSFGTNHKFYGYMDYFINIPNNTAGTGLNDFYLTFSLVPKENKFSSSIDIHYFTSNTSLENSAGEEKTIFGQEIDFTIKYNFIKGTTITWGGSVFIPGELMRLIFQPANDVGFWSYVMITANI
ncbi:MAG: hypothetical protein EHM47_02965 [Ignavibacteriales bacterium]|nr:MAG: hypothetical protein EHM47_02965 [Ignavibacteriales bacterium]